MRTSPKRWLREPLLHFLVIGVLLFAAYRMLHPEVSRTAEVNRIELTEDDLRQLEVGWTAQWRRPPASEEMQRLVDGRIREEILYREALALGIDRGDTIVKRRLAQKMEFLVGDISAVRDPTADELRAWYVTNGDRVAEAGRRSFRHVYFSTDRRGDQAQADAIRALSKLADKAVDSPVVGAVGDPFMFQDHYGDRSPEQIASIFGSAFAAAVDQVRPGSWQGPIESGLGWHLVFVNSATTGRTTRSKGRSSADGWRNSARWRDSVPSRRCSRATKSICRKRELRPSHLNPIRVRPGDRRCARLSMAWAVAGRGGSRRDCKPRRDCT